MRKQKVTARTQKGYVGNFRRNCRSANAEGTWSPREKRQNKNSAALRNVNGARTQRNGSRSSKPQAQAHSITWWSAVGKPSLGSNPQTGRVQQSSQAALLRKQKERKHHLIYPSSPGHRCYCPLPTPQTTEAIPTLQRPLEIGYSGLGLRGDTSEHPPSAGKQGEEL